MARPASGDIAGLILAAGASTRLGTPKQLVRFNDQPLVRIVAESHLHSKLDRLGLVVGHASDEVTAAVTGLDIAVIPNPHYRDGQSTSLHAGIAWARDADAIVVVLGDQPTIGPALIDRLIEARRAGASLAIAGYGELRGHPVLFGHEHYPALLAIGGDQGGRELLRRHAEVVVVVESGQHALPLDLDTPADIDSMRRAIERRDS